jgi:mRNA interferase MazF
MKEVPAARRGEVWFADVPGDKRRPVLVLSRDPMSGLLHSVIVAPVTSKIRGLATEFRSAARLGWSASQSPTSTNTFLLSRARLVRRLGRAQPSTMEAACLALAVATGCA